MYMYYTRLLLYAIVNVSLWHRSFVLRISVISPTFPILMDLRESMDHLWFPKYPECSNGLKEIRISSISSTFCVQLRMCVDEWLAYLLIMTCMTFHYVTCILLTNSNTCRFYSNEKDRRNIDLHSQISSIS